MCMICSKCNLNETTKTQKWCSGCKREYDKKYYRNPDNRKRHQERTRANQQKFIEWYNSLKDQPCTCCGNKYHPAAMQWDHRPGNEKVGNLSTLARRGNKSLVLKEIEKCDLVCANCHAVRTYERKSL